jgi:glycosyltransferase involved in cell wall biosynthesis
MIENNEAGRVAPPEDRAAFMARATELAGNEELRIRMGDNARAYAARTFDITAITDKFEASIARLPHGRA